MFAAFFELGRMDVVTDNEGQRATPPAEMVRSGRYLIPTINGADYLVKPPLLYWIVAAVYRATGAISEWTARIPTATAAVLLSLCLYFFTRRETDEPVARWAALILVASPYLLERARWANLDIPLTLAVYLCAVSLRAAWQAKTHSRRAVMTCASGLALGAGLMLKGPPALLFLLSAWLSLRIVEGGAAGRALGLGAKWAIPAVVLCLLQWGCELARLKYQPDWLPQIRLPVGLLLLVASLCAIAWRTGDRSTRFRDLAMLGGVAAVGIAIATPWALAALRHMGWAELRALLDDQVFQRTYVASRINSGSPLFYAVALLGIIAPWGLLLPFCFSRSQWHAKPSLYRFSMVNGCLGVVLFSLIAGKEREYILPAVPFLLIAVAYHLADLGRNETEPWIAKWSKRWLSFFTILLPVAVVGFAVYFTVAEPHPLARTEVWAMVMAAGLLSLLLHKSLEDRVMRLFVLNLTAIMLYLVAGRGYHYSIDPARSPRTLAAECQGLIDAGYTVEAPPRVHSTQPFPYPALSFYLARVVPMEENPARVAAKLHGPEPYYFLATEKYLRQWSKALGPAEPRVLLGPFTGKKLVLVGNRPLPEPDRRGTAR